MDIIFDRGLHLPTLGLWLDSRRSRVGCFVSHGHADHIAAHKRFVATGPTAAFLRRKHPKSEGQELRYGQPIEGPDYRLTLYPAGHCLGAAQMLIELENGRRIVYTGDIKLRPNPTAETAAVIPCDTLIIESTFGQPSYRFPPEEEAMAGLCQFIDDAYDDNATPVVLAYALGKGQEALHHLLARGYRVRYLPAIAEVVEQYQDWGVSFLGDHGPLSKDGAQGCVVLAPPSGRRHPLYKRLHRPRTAFLSGWAQDSETARRMYVDRCFPLSDHADYDELRRYVLESAASTVYTVNGFPHLAAQLQGEGLAARHLEGAPGPVQLSLPFGELRAL